jgi:hypothetical protein
MVGMEIDGQHARLDAFEVPLMRQLDEAAALRGALRGVGAGRGVEQRQSRHPLG